MKLNHLVGLTILLLLLVKVQAQDRYCKVKIYAPKDRTERANLLGLLQIDHFMVADDGGIISEISTSDLERLKAGSHKYDVLIPDVAAHLDSVNRAYFASLKDRSNRVAFEQPGSTIDAIIKTPSAFQVKPTFGGYYNFAEMVSAMNALVAAYPAIASKTSIGKTAEGRDIWMIKISDNVAIDETNEPEILYLGLQHAREAITGSSMIFFMQYLCENYTTDARIKDLVNNREFFIVPCFNPDGWEFNRTDQNGSAGGMWRKNRSKIDSTVKQNGTVSGYQYGVDLNRNWGVDWANCTGATSSCGSGTATSTTETYWGDSAFSELETRAVRNFAKEHHLVAGFDQHAFGPYYSLPFGRKGLHTMPVKGQNFYTAIPALMGAYNGMRAADSYDALGYEVAGGFKDWMLMGEVGTGTKDTVWAMTGEGGAGGGTTSDFWAPASQIINLSKGMCYQNLQLAYAAGTYVDVQDAGDIAVSSLNASFNFRIKRLGIGNEPVTVTLVPLENIQGVGVPVVINSLNYYDDYTGSISCNLSSSITIGQRIKFAWNVSTAGYSYSDTVVKFFSPITLFSDDMEGTYSNNWTATSNVTDNWNYTAGAYFSGSRSLTESPAGNYTANNNRTITAKNTFNLSDATAAYLTFWTKYRAENFRDKLQVQVSTNGGTSWTPVAGSTTVQEPDIDGSTLGGQPALTGIRDYWTQEVFDLSAYKGSASLSFRFVFTSDGDATSFKYEVDDGFYIDNVKLVKSTATFTTLPVHFINVTATPLQNKSVQVQWEVVTDNQNDHFEVERSANGSDFTVISKIANGALFSFIDTKPFDGNNYYRIKQVDKDGLATYSKVVSISIESKLKVLLYPNPVEDKLWLQLQSKTSETVTIRIADLNGQVLFSMPKQLAAGTNDLNIDMSTLSGQVYVLQVINQTNNILLTKKVIKL